MPVRKDQRKQNFPIMVVLARMNVTARAVAVEKNLHIVQFRFFNFEATNIWIIHKK